MTQTETAPLTAHQMIVAVMREVEGVAKRDRNTQQGFNFRGIDAVVNAVGPALRKHGGFILPRLEEATHEIAHTAKGAQINIVRVKVWYEIHGQTGEPVRGLVAAEAMDSGDKATAKAMSVAYRTFLLQALCLPTDEPDPDASSYEATPRDWKAEIAALKTKADAKALWHEAARAKAPAEVAELIQQAAAVLE